MVTAMPRPSGHPLNRAAWDDLVAIKGLSVTELAELADVPRSTISALIGGHNRASVTAAHRLAGALGVQVGTLFPSVTPKFAALDPAGVAS